MAPVNRFLPDPKQIKVGPVDDDNFFHCDGIEHKDAFFLLADRIRGSRIEVPMLELLLILSKITE